MSKLAQAGASSTTPLGFARANASSIASWNDDASWTSTASFSASRTNPLASPIATTAFARARSGSRKKKKTPPLEPPPDNDDEASLEAFDGPQSRFHIGGLRIIHESNAIDAGDEFHRVLEPTKGLDRLGHGHRRCANDDSHRRCRQDIAQEVMA